MSKESGLQRYQIAGTRSETTYLTKMKFCTTVTFPSATKPDKSTTTVSCNLLWSQRNICIYSSRKQELETILMQRRDWKSLIMWIMLSKSLRDSLKRIMVTSLSLGKETRSSAKSHSSSTPLTWYVLMEMGYDSPDLPIGMVAQLHLKRCEKALLEFIEKVKSLKEN